jgi:dCMP deaminase
MENPDIKKQRYADLYMDLAERISMMSYAKRLKVGSVLVKDNNIISFGWNGMPAGWDNECENIEFMPVDAGGWLDTPEIWEQWPYEDGRGRYRLKTKPEVLHSEANCLTKLVKSTNTSIGSTMFCTHAPCIDCAKLIHQSGIHSLYYRDAYRDDSGLKFLKHSGLDVIKHNR